MNFTAKYKFNELVDLVLMLDKEQLGNNPFLLQLISWIDRKTELNVPKDDDLKKFIEKYYDCDEIVAV